MERSADGVTTSYSLRIQPGVHLPPARVVLRPEVWRPTGHSRRFPTRNSILTTRAQWQHVIVKLRMPLHLLATTPTPPSMSDNKVLYVASLCAAASLATLVLRWQRGESRPPYPPGPRGYPLIGNVLDIPQGVPIWKAFISMAQKYSKFPALDEGNLIEHPTALRHRRALFEIIHKRPCRLEQLRSHLRLVGKALCNLFG